MNIKNKVGFPFMGDPSFEQSEPKVVMPSSVAEVGSSTESNSASSEQNGSNTTGTANSTE